LYAEILEKRSKKFAALSKGLTKGMLRSDNREDTIT